MYWKVQNLNLGGQKFFELPSRGREQDFMTVLDLFVAKLNDVTLNSALLKLRDDMKNFHDNFLCLSKNRIMSKILTRIERFGID